MAQDHLGLSALEEAKYSIEQLLKVKLEESYNSREDDNEDEEHGHFINFGIELDPNQEPLILQIYEDGKVQFFHDATPYPVAANTSQEARSMMQTLCHYPVPFEKVTAEDYNKVVETIKENF